jgi:ABC-type microcin C transport system permease subunit YejB
MSLTFSTANFMLAEIKAGFFMSIESRDIRKIGIWFLLLVFVFAAIILPLLSTDAPDAVTAVTFTLILILEILFALSLNPQRLFCTAYHFGIRPRSPPNS